MNEIEFQCEKCSFLLKVPAVALGKSAQCPNCNHIQTVVAPATGSAANPTGVPTNPPPGSMNQPTFPPPAGTPNPVSSPSSPPANPQFPLQSQSPMVAGSTPLQPVGSTSTASPTSAAMNSPVGSPMASSAPAPSLEKTGAATSSSTAKHEGKETATRKLFEKIRDEISKVYVGQEELVEGTLVALFSSGHVLIESVPGLGKTLFIRTLGKALGCDFGRIQFTADLMPSDVTGAPIFDMKTQEFEFRPGPVFTQLLLADEINRSPAKTHAALLETMQEYKVTIDGTSHELSKPFLVMATQNPIESEGTYNLPEAQLDRFMMKLMVNYPSEAEEARILDLHSRQVDLNDVLENEVATVTSAEEIVKITKENAEVKIVPELLAYINKLVRLTRSWPQFHMGASPRAGISLMQGARTLAAFAGRDYAIPDDVIQIAIPCLRHRVILTAEAEVEGQSVDLLLNELIRNVEVPRI